MKSRIYVVENNISLISEENYKPLHFYFIGYNRFARPS